MKYIVVLLDGAADEPNKKINYKTPLMISKMIALKKISKVSQIGLVNTIPSGMNASSDIANLNIMGYDPKKYHTGRAPLEAISKGIKINKNDIIIRLNFITLNNANIFEEKKIIDHSAGEISDKESFILIEDLKKNLTKFFKYKIFHGTSYRNILIWEKGSLKINFTPPHDILNKSIEKYLPKGNKSDLFKKLIYESYEFLKNHKINKKRILKGKNPANAIWLWGEGTKPKLDNFFNINNLRGGIISAVDLIKGIGLSAKMNIIKVDGITGNINTNFRAKGEEGLKKIIFNEIDYLYIHVEAPDECSHQGDIFSKIKSLELIDKYIISIILKKMKNNMQDFRLLILPDHGTSCKTKTHIKSLVPYLIYDSRKKINNNLILNYDEKEAKNGIFIKNAVDLHGIFIEKKLI